MKFIKPNSLPKIIEEGLRKLKRVEIIKESLFFSLPKRKNNKYQVDIEIISDKLFLEIFKTFSESRKQKKYAITVYFFNFDNKDDKKDITAYTYKEKPISKNEETYLIGLNFYMIYEKAEDQFEKCVNSFLHEFIHVIQLIYGLEEDPGSNDMHGIYFEQIKEIIHNNQIQTIKTRTQHRKTVYVNPDTETKAKKLYKDFNHHEPEKVVKLDIPISKDTVFVRLGEVENLEYVSDKAIFKSDKKTKKRKIRTYIHNFKEHNKKPLLLTNQEGNILVLYDPYNKIEVKPEGII